MIRSDLIILGAGGHGRGGGETVLAEGSKRLAGFLDARLPAGTAVLPGLNVLGGDEILEALDTVHASAPLAKQVRRRAAGRSEESLKRTYMRVQRSRHRLLRGVAMKKVRGALSSLHETLPLLRQVGWQ